MSNLAPVKIPNWVWLSSIPIFGGLAIVYAGNKFNNKNWMWLGIGLTGVALFLSKSDLAGFIWLAQVGTAIYLKQKTEISSNSSNFSRGYAIPDRKTASEIARKKGQIDINTCSKDELVYDLGLPIIYANDIESVRNEGYMFTHLEELHEIAGIPENYLHKIEPLIIFCYHSQKEADISWRRLNSYSKTELIDCGLKVEVVEKIVKEREKNGFYRSVIDLKNRTGIPIRYYKDII